MTEAQMISPAEQGEAASKDDIGAALFVSAEKDLVAKTGTHQDSWFIYGYLKSERGTLALLSHILHMTRPDGASFVQVMYSLLDPKTKKYLTQEKTYKPEECTFSQEKLEVLTPSGNFTGTPADLHLTGDFDGLSFDLNLTSEGPMLANMGNGLIPFLGDINYHYALPTLSTKGTVTMDGEQYSVTGPAWLDRQWGKTPRFFTPDLSMKWIWYGIMLDNGDRISVWDLVEPDREHAFATIVHANGGHEVVAVEPVLKRASKPWTSPDTGRVYPTKWDIRLPSIDGQLLFEPEVQQQEIVSPVKAHKYEGTTPLTGTIRGESVTGMVVIELVGDWT